MRRLLLCLLLWLAALPARAQDEPATLVADRVFLTAGDTLTAEGAVEVFYRGARLAARRIVYDGATAELTIEGPITLTDGAGTVILADQAELSRDLTYDDSAILAKDQEEQLLWRDMESDLVQQVLRRLSTIKPLKPEDAQ